MTHHYSKPIRKKLRELAGFAHERELSSALETLDSHFTRCGMWDGFQQKIMNA
jgi:hypothetical protein